MPWMRLLEDAFDSEADTKNKLQEEIFFGSKNFQLEAKEVKTDPH